MSQTCPICSNEFDDALTTCPACGFRKIDATQGFTPVDLSVGERDAFGGKPQESLFRIVRGPNTGVEIMLKEGLHTLGRDPSCDIFLNDMTVSRAHATVEVGPQGVIIADQNSYNGVWVNNSNVSRRLLADGDVVQIGEFCLLYKER